MDMEVRATAVVIQLMKFFTLLPALYLLSLTANAVPVVWHLDGVTFSDGGTASGSFTYDADTNSYSAIAITTTAGSARSGASYNALNPGYLGSGAEELVVVNSADGPDFLGDPVFFPLFNSPLTNSGGTVTIRVDQVEGDCADAACSLPTVPFRNITGGSVSTATTPPAAAQQIPALSLFGLLATALGLIAVAGRRLAAKKRRVQ
jgi:hypothetical protein